MITLIDRSRVRPLEGILSESSLDTIKGTLEKSGSVLIYLNRRGAFRAYVCEDCSHTWKCEHCDVALTFHNTPSSFLLCHHCGHKEYIPIQCPKCAGNQLRGVGIGIQEVERFLKARFHFPVYRLDSDSTSAGKPSSEGHITLATEFIIQETETKNDLLIVLTPESELAIPEYNIEERMYGHLRYLMQESVDTIIETSIPKSDFIRDLTHGNYKDFLVRTLAERKKYNYPPYGNIAYLEMREKNLERLSIKTATFVNKLNILEKSSEKKGEIIFDQGMRRKRMGEWIDTIVIRSNHLEFFISSLEKEILKNRGISLDIRGLKTL